MERARTTIADCLEQFFITRWWFFPAFITVAILSRTIALGYPNGAIFDETLYANFALFTLFGTPYFDIHPPLIKVLHALLLSLTTFTTTHVTLGINATFGDFPFVLIRSVHAIIGAMIPLLLYAIARALSLRPAYALIPAVLALIEPTLIAYSRTMLPDVPLVALLLFGVYTTILALRSRSYSWLSFVTGVLLGCALGVKWTSVGLVIAAIILFVVRRKYADAFVVIATTILTYIAIWVLTLFFFFPNGGVITTSIPELPPGYLAGLPYPHSDALETYPAFIAAMHERMYHANALPVIQEVTLHALHASAWPTGFASLGLWGSSAGTAQIIFAPNVLVWLITLFALLRLGMEVVRRIIHTRSITSLPITLWAPLIMYAGMYTPYLLIPRPMFPYHYLFPLMLSFIILPTALPYLMNDFRTIVALPERTRRQYTIALIVCILLVACFLSFLAYGLDPRVLITE